MLGYMEIISYIYFVRLRDMKWTNDNRLWRAKNRCNKQKHDGVVNPMGVTWCKDCGLLMKTI